MDNSLDGALRVGAGAPDYATFWVRISMSADSFKIVDNCGGIDRETAHRRAFRFGRDPADAQDAEIETIGMYGVGMKRAMFKMGHDAVVKTTTSNDSFSVRFSREWMSTEVWEEIAIDDRPDEALEAPGTEVTVTELREGIGTLLGSADFVAEVRRAIGEHFTMFLGKGFTIEVNDEPVPAASIHVLLPTQDLCTPYYAEDRVGGTRFSVIVGVNPRIFRVTDDEDEEPDELTNNTMPEAGWNIFCNDRAVLVGDKSRLTGWGTMFANFHPQFAVLTGMVHFQASDARDLPVTTTKRALDATAQAWLVAARLMGDGMKSFISYTNAWKNAGRRAQWTFFENATRADVAEASRALRQRAQPLPPNRRKQAPYRLVYDPKKANHLPRPIGPKSDLKRIKFARPGTAVDFLGGRVLAHVDSWTPSQVGEACFDRVLEQETADGSGK